MILEPRLEYREKHHYMAIRNKVTLKELGTVLPPLHLEIFKWLKKNGIEPSGPPFFRYLLINMKSFLEIDVGIPVTAPVEGDGRIEANIIPEGNYAILTHLGHYDNLINANAELHCWAEKKGIKCASKYSEDGVIWKSRVEYYFNDPGSGFDPNQWRTDIAYLVQ